MADSIFKRASTVNDMPTDEVYVIYGIQGSGKTVLASSFPKPLLYLDIMEGDTGSIPEGYRDGITVLPIYSFDEVDEVLKDIERGYSMVDGEKVDRKYATIVFNTATQLEFLLKKGLMEEADKDRMSLNLYGNASTDQDFLWNMAKRLHQQTGSKIVIVTHQKEFQDENHPEFNKLIPSLMVKSAYGVAAKASFVWFTKFEYKSKVDDEGKVQQVPTFYTYIDSHPYLLTKTRKPPQMKIPQRVKDLTYPKFKKNVLDKLK